jgi:hypothetical protein
MEQNKILEIVLARMDVDKAEAKRERKADKEEIMARMDANKKVIQRKMDANRQDRKAHREEMGAEMDAWLGGVTHAYLEKEPTPEETEAVEEPQEVPEGVMEVEEEPAPEKIEVVAERQEAPEGATGEEAIGAAKDRAGELRLVVRHHRQRKKRAQEMMVPGRSLLPSADGRPAVSSPSCAREDFGRAGARNAAVA